MIGKTDKKKVLVAMSGGVDSSVAAAVLISQGYEVIGVTMQIWPDKNEESLRNEGGCCSLSAVDDARRVAEKLGIPYYVMNFKELFKEKVINYFISEYFAGNTPNPCISCNKHLKFDALLKKASAMSIDYVATGHYARISYDKEIKRYLLRKSVTGKKDQTYALYNLTQEQLARTLMPIGDFTKDRVREIASEFGLQVASKPDSQEICFIDDNNYGNYISENAEEHIKEGFFTDTEGNILGKHPGIIHFTIGQRKGLGLSLGRPAYVVKIDPVENTVVLGNESDLYSYELIAGNVNYIAIEKLEEPLRVKSKIRYSAQEADATIYPLEQGAVRVIFDNPQRAVTPGQSVVFYKDDAVIGGGEIAR